MELDSGFKDRLKWAINHKQSNQSELAREVEKRVEGTCSPQAIQQWVSGVTSSPRREHLRAASEFLGVRYEWLAYGRGPMREVDLKQPLPPARVSSEETALLAHEWECALLAALPDDAQASWQQSFAHPTGTGDIRLTWASEQVIAELGLYKHTTSLIASARQMLWRLTVARAIIPGNPRRRVVLLLAPLEEGRDVPERHIGALRAEAQAAGIEVRHVTTPEQAAAVLLGQNQDMLAPETDDLGLDVSPVL